MFWLEKVLLRTVSRNLFADFPALIQERGLNWTIVRPARLTNGPKTGVYPSGERIFIHPFTSISRADVADFLRQETVSPEHQRQVVTIRY